MEEIVIKEKTHDSVSEIIVENGNDPRIQVRRSAHHGGRTSCQ